MPGSAQHRLGQPVCLPLGDRVILEPDEPGVATISKISTISTISMQVRTMVNGKTICQVTEEIKEDAENMPTETKEAPM